MSIIICFSSILYVIHFFQQQSFNEVLAELKKIKGNYLFILSITFCTNAVGSFALMLCFNYKIPIKKFLLFHAVDSAGNSISKVTPTNILVGDSYKVLPLYRYGVAKTNSTSALIVYRIYCLLSNFAFFFICLILYFVSGIKEYHIYLYNIIVVILGVFLFGVILFFLSKKNDYARRFTQKIRNKIHNKPKLAFAYKKVEKVALTIRRSFQEHKLKFLFLLALTTSQRFGGVLELFFLLKTLNVQTSFYSCMLFEMGIIIIRILFTAIPMQLGIEEVWNKFLLGFIGRSGPQTWLTVSIIKRFRMFTWILYGFLFLLILNIGKLTKKRKYSRS